MATISPVIGAPNSFTAIDEAFVTTEIVEPGSTLDQMQEPTYTSTAIPEDTVFEKVTVTAPNASGMPIKRSIEMPMQMDKENDTMEAFLVGGGVGDYATEKEKFVEVPSQPRPLDTHAVSYKENQVYSPGYFQRALDAVRGRRNSESYSAHTSLRKDNLENTNYGESSHSRSLGVVSAKEINSTQGSFNLNANLVNHHGIGHPGTRRASLGSIDAPYNIYGSTHPSVVGRKGSDRSDSIMDDLDRGYHNALDSLKHVIGWDKHTNPASAQNAAQFQPRPVVDSAAENFSQLEASKNSSDPYLNYMPRGGQPQQQSHASPLSSLTDQEFPLLI